MSTTSRYRPALAPANGIELCYDTFGDRDAAPLMLIMGLAAQMIAWDEEFCARLASRGYWVIRFDNRDIGLSTKFTERGVPDVLAMLTGQGGAPAAPYTLRDMATDTIGLMDALGIAKAHVVGASMGGAIAQEMAIHHSGRLRTMTSIMSSTGEPGLPPPTAEAIEILLAPTPTDREAYFIRYAQTWRVLRGPGFPADEARDADRAAESFDRGLNPPGVARQPQGCAEHCSCAGLGHPWRCRPVGAARLRHRDRQRHAGSQARGDRRHGSRAATIHVAADHRGNRRPREMTCQPLRLILLRF